MTQWVYTFGGGKAEGDARQKDLLGGKGANLAEMSNLGLPVPPGFTISTKACAYYYKNGRTLPDGLQEQALQGLKTIEQHTGAVFGDAENPLLVSVRSGAKVSMPGMMDTVLNLGLNDTTVEGLARRTSNPRFAYDCYRRFIQMYSDVVLGVPHHDFEDVLDWHKANLRKSLDTDLTAEDWQAVIKGYKQKVLDVTDEAFPQDPMQQLWKAADAVFASWMTPRAVVYRKLHQQSDIDGTAVNIQAMVFGNQGDDCATGVAFTRNPSTGAKEFYGEYLINAQGEDVVAGIRTPQDITRAAAGKRGGSMEDTMPEVYAQLREVAQTLETHFRDMQDIEFTIQNGILYMLQTRTGKRTAQAAMKIAVDMVEEGLIDEREAVRRIEPASLDQILHPRLDPDSPRTVLATGLPASPGAASGIVVFTADEAEALAKKGQAVILVRAETSPEDIHGMHAAKGILTSRGGMTSHAAVVARGMGRPCVAGCSSVRIDAAAQTMTAGSHTVRAGEAITLDGGTGDIFLGQVPTIDPQLSGDFATIMGWADSHRRMKIFTNAETPLDARTARRFGAEGIGLCRTEHMFFDEERILHMRKMIVAGTEEARKESLAALLPMQRADFAELFAIMEGQPVMIRLLDPPLHEFLPHADKEMQQVADAAGVSLAVMRGKVAALHESNPMLGHRGCRLGITMPDIYTMQARAIFEAQLQSEAETGKPVQPQIMLPLIASGAELELLAEGIHATAQAVQQETGKEFSYVIGTMIELPRAALRAGEIARQAQFFSFGTNDLTQTTYGISRDDAASFLQPYLARKLLPADPFVSLDVDGVGELIRIACERGRAERPDIKIGICGEHGGDTASIAFCQQVGMDYVSCSPYRVPIARLAAAQAALAQPVKAQQSSKAA